MATIEEVGRASAELAKREADALANLANHLRGAIVELPAQSLVARHFVHLAPRLDAASDRREHMAHAAFDGFAQLLFEVDQAEAV